jgi:hypothetical protein
MRIDWIIITNGRRQHHPENHFTAGNVHIGIVSSLVTSTTTTTRFRGVVLDDNIAAVILNFIIIIIIVAIGEKFQSYRSQTMEGC